MGLRNDIQTDLGDAFDNELADAVRPFTLTQITSEGYDAYAEVIHTSRGVFDAYRRNEIENQAYLPTDVKLIVLVNELAATPSIDDLITDVAKNIIYKIIRVKTDPADAHWEIQCRI